MNANELLENKKVIEVDGEETRITKINKTGYRVGTRTTQIPAYLLCKVGSKFYIADGRPEVGEEQDGYISISKRDIKNDKEDHLSEILPQLFDVEVAVSETKKKKKKKSQETPRAKGKPILDDEMSSGSVADKVDITLITKAIASALRLDIREAIDAMLSKKYLGLAPITICGEFDSGQIRSVICIELSSPEVDNIILARSRYASKIIFDEKIRSSTFARFGSIFPIFNTDEHENVYFIGVSSKTKKFVCLIEGKGKPVSFDESELVLAGSVDTLDSDDFDETDLSDLIPDESELDALDDLENEDEADIKTLLELVDDYDEDSDLDDLDDEDLDDEDLDDENEDEDLDEEDEDEDDEEL